MIFERVVPRRKLTQKHTMRWGANFGIFIVDSVLTRVLVAAGGIAVAGFASKQGWGLFNLIEVPLWAAIALSLVILDFAVWAQHVASHRWNWFWRLHRLHHSDLDIDVTTALRFHPGEILVSLTYKSAVILLLGPPLMAVFIFEIALNGFAMFNHSNLRLPLWLDNVLRLMIVTPDMHRVHHSTDRREHDHNFGFCLSLWDRLFRVYTAQPREGHEGMDIGLPEFRDKADQRFGTLLVQPLKPL